MSIRFTSKFHYFVFKNRHGIHFCCRCRGPRNTTTTHKTKLYHKSTNSEFRTNTNECEKCQKLIDAIFGDGKYGESATTSYQDGPDIQAMDRSKLSQIMTQMQVNPETKLQKFQRIISQALGDMEDNAANEVPSKLDAKILKAVETEKQDVEKLITKVEKLNEYDNAESSIRIEKRGPPPNEINIQHTNFSLSKINNNKFDLEHDFIAVTKQCLNVLPEHIDGLILKQLEDFNRPKSIIDERIVPPLSYVVNNIINNSPYNNMVFFKSGGSKGEKSKQPVIKKKVRTPQSSPKIQNTEPPVTMPIAAPTIRPTPSSPSHETLSPAFQPAITDKPLKFAGMGHYDVDSQVFHMEAFLAPCREVILDNHSVDKRNKEISKIPTNVKDDKLFKEAASIYFEENINEKLPTHTGSIRRDLNRHEDKGIIENYVSNTNSDINEEFSKSLEINKREIEKKYNLYVTSKNKKENLNLSTNKADNYTLNDNIPTHANSIKRDLKNCSEDFVSNTNSNDNEEFGKSLQSNKREIENKYDFYTASKKKKGIYNLNAVETNKYNLNENYNRKSSSLYKPQYSKPISSSQSPDIKHSIETNAEYNNIESEQNKMPSQHLNIDSTKLTSPLESDLDRHQNKTDTKKIPVKHNMVNNMGSDPKIRTLHLNMEPTKPAAFVESDSNQSNSDNNETQIKHIVENNANVDKIDRPDTKIKSSQYINTKPKKPDSEKHQSKTNTLETRDFSHHTLLPPVFDFRKGTWINVPVPKKGSSQTNTKSCIDEKKHDYLKNASVQKQNTFQDSTSVSNDNQISSSSQSTKIDGPVLKDNTYSHDGVPSRYKQNSIVQSKNDSNVSFVSDHSKPWLIHPTNRENPPSHISNIDEKEKKKIYDKYIANFKREQAKDNLPLLTKSKMEKKVQSQIENTCISLKQDYLINSTNTPIDQRLSNKDDYKFPNVSRSCSYTKKDNNIKKWSDLKNENKEHHWHMAHIPHTCYHNHYMYNKQFHNPFYKSGHLAQQDNQHTPKDNVKESVAFEKLIQPNADNTVLHSATPKENKDNENQDIEANSQIMARNIVPSLEKPKEEILHYNRNDKMKPELINNPTSLDAVKIPSLEKHKEETLIDNENDKIRPELVNYPTSLDAVKIPSLEKHKEETLIDNENDKIEPELVNNPTSLDAVKIPSLEKHKEETLIDNENDKIKPELNKSATTLDAVQNILNVNAAQIAPKEEEIPIKPIKTIEEIPKKLSLQELLKEVRARNHRENAERKNKLSKETDDPVGKCGDKKAPCPPPPPVCPPPPPPPQCPKPCPTPEPKPSCPPEPCGKPRKPCPKKTCFTKLEDTPQIIIVNPLRTPLDLKPVGSDENDNQSPDTVLEKSMGLKEVFVDCAAIIEDIVDDIFFNINNLFLARSFDPWTPIPSWPISKRDRKRPFICPKEGCKLPVPKMSDQCREKPCQGFPKRER